LETLARRLVLAYSGSPIEIVRGTVVNVHASRDGSQIDSITLRTDSGDSNAATDGISTATSLKTIATSLFVDCSGPSSISAKMLPAATVGWGPFPRHQYNPLVSYRTAFVTVPEHVREAISRSVPKGDRDYGRWDHMAHVDAFVPTSETGRDGYTVQRVGDCRTFYYCLFLLLTVG